MKKYEQLEDTEAFRWVEAEYLRDREIAFKKSLGGFTSNLSPMSERAIEQLDYSSANPNPLE